MVQYGGQEEGHLTASAAFTTGRRGHMSDGDHISGSDLCGSTSEKRPCGAHARLSRSGKGPVKGCAASRSKPEGIAHADFTAACGGDPDRSRGHMCNTSTSWARYASEAPCHPPRVGRLNPVGYPSFWQSARLTAFVPWPKNTPFHMKQSARSCGG